MESIVLNTPLKEEDVLKLKIGDKVLISGHIYSARDAAHKRMIQLLEDKKELPFDVRNQIIYYVGPTPAKPGAVIGSAGPTTSGRMDVYTPTLIKYGLKGMIGKGFRSQGVKDAMKEHKAVYFGAVGGAGAIISKSIIASELIAFEDLGTEAIRKLTVKNFPVVVLNDTYGGDLYTEGIERFHKILKKESV